VTALSGARVATPFLWLALPRERKTQRGQ